MVAPMDDETLMRRAIQLAQARVGLTGENPAVGCVIARGGKIIGEGATGEGGRPHAEEQALAAAGDQAREATAYVTLEPCAQRSAGGASCSMRLLEAGVKRVVVAHEDPSIFAGSAGPSALVAGGVVVECGLLRGEAATLYDGYRPARKPPLITPR